MPAVALEGVIGVHAQEASSLYLTRVAQLQSPHIDLPGLERFDDRLLAHFDGLSVAGDHAQRFLDAELETPSGGAAFAAAVYALESGRADALDRLWMLANDEQPVRDGLTAAFGWVDRRHLNKVVVHLLGSAYPSRKFAGLAACAMHRTDPGLDRGRWLDDQDSAVRARALRAVGELACAEAGPRCVAAIADDDPECQFWAVWSAVLLGNRGAPLNDVTQSAVTPDAPHRERAFRLALQVMTPAAAHALLQRVGEDASQIRYLIRGSGINGDPAYVSWLIRHMADEKLARLAGESFSLITGADLDALQLWRDRPENIESGPTEEPEDENVELDPDEGLMWPDAVKVQRWWNANSNRFQPGQRYFMGAPVTREHCIEVLKNGYQRQRILAAHYLCLLNPGTPLFNTSAPAWRQQKLLAQM